MSLSVRGCAAARKEKTTTRQPKTKPSYQKCFCKDKNESLHKEHNSEIYIYIYIYIYIERERERERADD